MGGILLAASVVGGTTWSLADLASTYSDTGSPTTTYRLTVVFQTDATVDIQRLQNTDLLNEQDPYVDPTSEAANTWVRATVNFGNALTGGDATGTWHQLNVQRTFELEHTSSGGDDTIQSNVTFELASDSGGSSIEASATMTITVGEAL